MVPPDNDFKLGRHEGLIERIVVLQEQLAEDVSEIKTTLAEQKGERRAVATMWGVVGGACVAFIAALLKNIVGLHS